jgi:hypothetical protein
MTDYQDAAVTMTDANNLHGNLRQCGKGEISQLQSQFMPSFTKAFARSSVNASPTRGGRLIGIVRLRTKGPRSLFGM